MDNESGEKASENGAAVCIDDKSCENGVSASDSVFGKEEKMETDVTPMSSAENKSWSGNSLETTVSPLPARGQILLSTRKVGQSTNGTQADLWVETKTDDGKSYFYNALSRDTTWTKPEGPNIRVMMQSEIEDINKMQKQTNSISAGSSSVAVVSADSTTGTEKAKEANRYSGIPINAGDVITTQPPPNMLQTTPMQPQLSHPPPNVAQPMTQHPPPPMQPQPGHFFQSNVHSSNFMQPPFGIPPPAYGGFPAGTAPWGMPWAPPMHTQVNQQEKPAKNLIIKPGVIDPAVIARAAEWSEHRAPDGRPYYYHAARGESVWDKPQALRDMEAARMAAHSGAAPQQVSVPSAASHTHMSNAMMHMPPNHAMPYDPAHALHTTAVNIPVSMTKLNDATKLAATANAEKESKKLAESKKKEEEQKKILAASAKPVDKSRPISSTPIAGTPWCVVWTGDARVFYYNPSSRSSVWDRPEELTDRADVDKAVSNPPEQLKTLLQTNKIEETKIIETETDKLINEQENDEDDVIKIGTESESSVEEIPNKKPKLGTKAAKKLDANEAAVEAEVKAAKERALVPLETRVRQFKEMLREKDVSAFSTWEKELHKIVFDPRYLLLTSRERKQVFEKYVKDRAEEERKEKRNKMRQKRDDFRQLMEEANLSGKSSFGDFCQRFSRDERYKGIEKIRERESLFNEHIIEVRRREKEEKMQRKEQIRRDFMEMLQERSDIDRHTRWQDIRRKFESDIRYRAVESSMYREEYFEHYVRVIKDEKRRQKEIKDREREKQRDRERERARDKDRAREKERKSEKKSNRKDKEKGKDRSRSKDKEQNNDKESKEKEHEKDAKREKKHDDATDEEENSKSEDDINGRLQKEREKQLRAEQSIREREREVQRTLAGHLRDRDKEREHHKRDEAIGHFNALLIDLVRNPDLTWKEVKRQLRRDHRWELLETLDRDDREKLFMEHIDSLLKKKREKFREMLDEISSLELTSSWKDIKKLIVEDPRYLKYNSDKCEREFRDYMKDKTQNAKIALRELLRECKLITHKTVEMVKENPSHLKEIQDILKNDKRYLDLEHISDERLTIIVDYLEELHKRGPPPPPTASESTRRNK